MPFIKEVTTALPELFDKTLVADANQLTWIIVFGFILAFVLSFGVGANDVANVFGTSVGSKVLTLYQACFIATIAETLGAIMLGYKVSDTVRKGILDVSLYNNTEKELMLGSLAALGGSSAWNLVATFFKLPISGTHSIVGATVGFSLCARGFNGVNWITFGKIVASWFVSPVMSGIMSITIYVIIRRFIIRKEHPLENGLKALPLFYGITILVNVFSIVHDGPQLLHLNDLPWWGSLVIAGAVGISVALLVQLCVVPRQRLSIQKYLGETSGDKVEFTIGSIENSRSPTPDPPKEITDVEKGQFKDASFPPLLNVDEKKYQYNGTNHKDTLTVHTGAVTIPDEISNNSSQQKLVSRTNTEVLNNLARKGDLDDAVKDSDQDSYEVSRLFSFLQILTATFGSFAHGGNDVSNAIGPLIALWAIYTEGNVLQKSETPLYLLFYGGVGISVGLWVWGRRVIQTIGQDLTKVTPSSGFTIEIGSALTVLFASKIGLPISTTHCKVGSVVFVGWTKSSKGGVDWKLFRNIVIAWVVTVPLTAGISALLMLIFKVSIL